MNYFGAAAFVLAAGAALVLRTGFAGGVFVPVAAGGVTKRFVELSDWNSDAGREAAAAGAAGARTLGATGTCRLSTSLPLLTKPC